MPPECTLQSKNLFPDPLKKQTIFIQSTQTNYEYDTPIGHPQFTYPEIDYLSIIASPSHEGHVPFKKNQEIYTI